MQLLHHFHKLSIHPKNASELKGLILQLSIQGKLTAIWRKQNPKLISGINSAENLLKRINLEKARLIKEKKIKREKPLSEITEKEFPFTLPKNWTWCRLNEVSEYIQRGKSPKYSEIPKIPVVSQKCVQWSGFNINKARFITEESLEKYQDERFLVEGDLLWNSTGNGTIGRTVLLPKLKFDKVVADSHVTVVRPFRNNILSKYLWIYSACPLVQKTIEGRVSGSTKQTELGTGTVKTLEFALPPLEEQKEIVRVVEILFKEVEQLETLTQERVQLKQDYVASALHQLATQTQTAWEELTPHFSNFFDDNTNIKKLRETILQLAVQGKLTADWRARHPELVSGSNHASELLKNVQREKAQLVKEKKIKKEKALPAITPEEIPYELPEGWVWCRLNDVCEYIQRGKSPKYTDISKIPVVSQKCVQWSGFDISRARFITEESLEKYVEARFLQEGDLLWNSTGDGTIGRVISYPGSEYKNVVADSHVTVVRGVKKFINTDYLWIFTASPLIQNLVAGRVSGSTKQTELGTGTVKSMEFSFPPLHEQKAIVEKVNALMVLCDALEQEVQTGEQQLEDLMQSVLREVFEGKKKEKVALPMAAEPEGVYEKSTFDEIFESLNYDHEVAAVVLLSQQRFGFTYGKKYIHKMFSNIDFLNELRVFKELQFQENGWGMYSPIIHKTLENEVFVTYKSLSANKKALQVKPKAIPKINKWINARENEQFINQVEQMLTIYEQPLIDRNMDRIELLNTVLECITVLKTDLLKDIRSKMKNWKMFEGNYKTKAEKFSENETLHMIHFIKGLKQTNQYMTYKHNTNN